MRIKKILHFKNMGAIPRLLICLGVLSEAHKDRGVVGSQISK